MTGEKDAAAKGKDIAEIAVERAIADVKKRGGMRTGRPKVEVDLDKAMRLLALLRTARAEGYAVGKADGRAEALAEAADYLVTHCHHGEEHAWAEDTELDELACVICGAAESHVTEYATAVLRLAAPAGETPEAGDGS